MNNIEIFPYPNLKISEECIERDVKPNTVTLEADSPNPLDFKKPLMMITKFNNGDTRVLRPGPPVTVDENKYCSVFPNPVHLFFDSSISSLNQSEEIKKNSFPKCAKDKNISLGEVKFLDIDADKTHACYNEFFKHRMTSIIMLSTSVEAFINHSIPNTYPERDKIERYGKFKDKLKDHLPSSLGLTDFWADKGSMFEGIMGLYFLRNDLVHLKANSQDDFEAYYEVVCKMLECNVGHLISVVAQFMNEIQPGFVGFKS